MKKKLAVLFIVTICSSFCALAQEADNVPYRGGLTIACGLNQFPYLYFPTTYRNANNVLYGYSFELITSKRKALFRFGISTNYYREKAALGTKVTDYSCGFSLGIEKPLLSQKRRWLINVGLLGYYGFWNSIGVYSPTHSEKIITKTWSVAPSLVIGWKLNSRLTLATELSVGFGGYSKMMNGATFEKVFPSAHIWRMMGITLRFNLKHQL